MLHVISRFHDRRYYMDLEGARETYLRLLGEASKVHDARIIAYCLMSSHIHLVLQLGTDPLGTLMKRVHSAFGNWVNTARGGLGSVMADRPKSVLVHTETYGMELIRYVHNNPVRAGVVSRASESGWSSHRDYLGLREPPYWLATEAVFGADARAHESIRRDFAEYVDEGRAAPRCPEFGGEISSSLSKRIRGLMGGEVTLSYPVMGPDSFVIESVKAQAKRHESRKRIGSDVTVETVTSAVFDKLGIPCNFAVSRSRRQDVARGRRLTAWLWVECLGRPQVMVAEGLKVKSGAVSIMLKKMRIEQPTKEDAALMESVLETMGETKEQAAKETEQRKYEPKVFVLQRNRQNAF